MLYLHVTFRNEALSGNKRTISTGVPPAGWRFCANRGRSLWSADEPLPISQMVELSRGIVYQSWVQFLWPGVDWTPVNRLIFDLNSPVKIEQLTMCGIDCHMCKIRTAAVWKMTAKIHRLAEWLQISDMFYIFLKTGGSRGAFESSRADTVRTFWRGCFCQMCTSGSNICSIWFDVMQLNIQEWLEKLPPWIRSHHRSTATR